MESIINQIIQALSLKIFQVSNGLLSNVENVVSNNQLFAVSKLFIFVFLTLVLFVVVKRMIYFMDGRQEQAKGYIYEHKRHIYQMALLLFICLFPQEILQFSFNFWNSFINEREVFSLLEELPQQMDNSTIATSIMMFLSSLSALLISLTQTVEAFSLSLTLLLTPFILIGALFKTSFSKKFIKMLIEGVFSPIIQTFFIFFFFDMIFPLFIVEEQFSPMITSLLIFGMIVFSFSGTKQVSKLLFHSESKKDNTIETQKENEMNLTK